jgi:uncharacterized membrane protein
MTSSQDADRRLSEPSSGLARVRGISTGMRLAVALVIGLLTAAVTAVFGSPAYAPAIGWDVGAGTVLVWVWLTIWPMSSDDTAAHATREDPTRPVSDVILLGASVVSLGAIVVLLLTAGSGKGTAHDLVAAVGLVTVALSWFVVHTVFTLRYALLYHAGHDGGIDFNQTTPPRYSDFAYMAFTLGMTFQVSDTDVQTPAIRATVLRHALLSYLFGVVIVAITINLVAGLASGG